VILQNPKANKKKHLISNNKFKSKKWLTNTTTMVNNIWKNLIEIKRSKMLKMLFKNLVRLLLVYKVRLQVIRVQYMQNIMLIEVMLLWPLDTIKKQCMILELLSDLMINKPNIMQIEEIV
jgi:hypothetical protein